MKIVRQSPMIELIESTVEAARRAEVEDPTLPPLSHIEVTDSEWTRLIIEMRARSLPTNVSYGYVIVAGTYVNLEGAV